MKDLETQYSELFVRLLRTMGAEYMKIVAQTFVEGRYNEAVRTNSPSPINEKLQAAREKLLQSPQIKKVTKSMVSIFERMDGKVKKRMDDLYQARGYQIPKTSLQVPSSLKQAIQTNVKLIGQIVNKQSLKLEKAVMKAVIRGSDFKTVQKEVAKQSQKGTAYARFVAKDQIGKAYGAINKERQQQVGMPGYIWSCFLDSKTRATHKACHGKFFYWNKPVPNDIRPRMKNGKICNPGDDNHCRCEALPAFDESDAKLLMAA